MSLESFQAQGQAHVGGVAIREPVAEATRPLLVVEGKGKAITTNEQDAQSPLALYTPKRRIRDSPSPANAETSVDTDRTNNGEEKTVEIDEGQARSDPGKTPESRPPPDDDKMYEDQAGLDPGESRVALAGPNPEPTHEDFMADVYPNVHESLKFPDDEHVILEDPLSSSGTLSSMKNLDDAYTIEDQFINDKSTEDEPGKLNVEAEVVSMVTVLIYQASSSAPPLSTPAINLSPPKHVPSTTQAPFFTATTTTTTTTFPFPPPPQQQSTTDSKLAARVTELEKKFSDFEQKSNTLDKTTKNLGSRVFTLELRDMPHKIDETVREAVKEAVQVAYKLPLEIASDTSLTKSCKRCHDDRDPPHPRLDSNLSKKKRHESDASGSSQPPAPQSLVWKTSDTREAPSSSSKQQSGPYSEQQVEDVPMPDTTHLSDSEDTDSAHLPKIKSRPE
ncbi:hypothetical protein Tco_1320494 [Tanacetum coccineum]